MMENQKAPSKADGCGGYVQAGAEGSGVSDAGRSTAGEEAL